MEITTDRESLATILGHTQGVVDKRHSMAVLTNVLLEAKDGKLDITATDLEISLRQSCPATVKKDGRAATSARKLFEIVREASGDEVSIKVLENQQIEISYGRSNFKLMGIDPDEHPGMPAKAGNGQKAVSIEMESTELAEVIRKTIFAVSLDDTRSNLAGVYLEKGKKGVMRMVATDGHRLAMIDRKISGELPTEGVILPRKGLAEVAKLLVEQAGPVTIVISGNDASMTLGDCVLSMRLVDGNFPDYQQVIPSETNKLVGVGRDALYQTVKRIAILSSERARGIRLTLKDGSMDVSAKNPDIGEATEDVEVEYSGDELEIGFNAKYFLDVLGVLPEGSRVELGLGDELSPGVVSGDDADYRYVVMPMRT